MGQGPRDPICNSPGTLIDCRGGCKTDPGATHAHVRPARSATQREALEVCRDDTSSRPPTHLSVDKAMALRKRPASSSSPGKKTKAVAAKSKAKAKAKAKTKAAGKRRALTRASSRAEGSDAWSAPTWKDASSSDARELP